MYNVYSMSKQINELASTGIICVSAFLLCWHVSWVQSSIKSSQPLPNELLRPLQLTALRSLFSSGNSPYARRDRAMVVREDIDPLHFYGSVNGSPIPMLKTAPRLPRSPPRSEKKSPPQSPSNVADVLPTLQVRLP